MIKSTSIYQRPINQQVGDKVYLFTRNLKNYRPSYKLAGQQDSPFSIVEQVGHSYRLALPEGSKIYDVFAPDILSKDPEDPLPGQENPKPSREAIDSVEEQEVEEILAI